jgi:hypothetical protein
MKRIGMTLAAAVVGGVLLTAGQAGACESHRVKADAVPAPVEPGQQEKAARAEPAPAKKDEGGELHAAKCRCSSAADCTCKKGSCECAKCKKPRQRLDASAGIFIQPPSPSGRGAG